MTTLNLTPTYGDFLMPGDLLYDGPHRGVVVRWYPTPEGQTGGPHYTHYDISADGIVYRVALRSDQLFQVVRRYVDLLDVVDRNVPVWRIP